MSTTDPNLPDDPHEAAALWFTREHGGTLAPEDRRAFEAWRRADPRHEQAYAEMLRVWRVAEATPDAVFEAALRGAPASIGARAGAARPTAPRATADAHPATFTSRRRALALGLGATACAAVAVAWVAPEPWFQHPEFSASYASPRGERRLVDLPDGSVLALNTDTLAQVRFYAGERQVVLERGEAFFQVAALPDRPFVVEAGLATVTVTGTRFNVRRDAGEVTVAVQSGSVEVAGGRWWRREVRRLAAAQAVRVAEATGVSGIASADVSVVSAWRQGKVVFDATPLETIVAEMNRYRRQPVVLQDAALRRLRVAGVFSIDEPDAFLEVLPALAPVSVLRLADGRLAIVPR